MPDPFVRPDVAAFLAVLNGLPGPKTHELTPAEARAQTRALAPLADLPVGELAVIRDLACPGPAGEVPLRLFDARDQRGPGPVVVYFHGGGFVLGDLDSYAPLCAAIARGLDLPVVSVGYRLAPEHRYPAAIDDCEAAARWVAQSPAALDRPATGLALAGDSAGGALTVATALALRDAPAARPVLAQWPIYPAVDAAAKYPSYRQFGEGYMLTRQSMAWFHDHYRADLDHWRGAPMIADQTGMPPTLVLGAGLDPLLDQARAYAAATCLAGVPTVYREAAGNIHGFLSLRKAIPSAERDLAGALAIFSHMVAEAAA